MRDRVSDTTDPAGARQGQLLAAIEALVLELHPHLRDQVAVRLDSVLDRDLGIDSLARMELLSRIESEFGVVLPERAMVDAETPRDVLRILETTESAHPQEQLSPNSVPEPPGADAGTAVPGNLRTLIEVLNWHADRHPDRVHMHLYDDQHVVEPLTYGQLREGSLLVAAGLQQAGLSAGGSVAIMLTTGVDYFFSFLGVLLAGGTPVPIYPPARLTQLEDHFSRHARILDNARAEIMITFDEARAVVHLLTAQVPALRKITTVSALSDHGLVAELPVVGAPSTAFLQYTSGSTGNPKGVILSHADLLASLRSMGQALEVGPDDVFVSWLPLYHDMGLIGAWMGSLYHGFSLVLMSPLQFLARPQRWLRAIHDHRGTLSGGPNFAYEVCLRRIADTDLTGLDLSSWRIAFNGAEPVSHETMQRFSERFAPYGLSPQAMMPVYGLAEATLGVAFTPVGRGPLVERVQRSAMSQHGRALPALAGEDAISLVSSGVPIPGFQVRIVDESGRESSEREEGKVQFKGPATTKGYFRNAEATRALFDGDWLESGDRGFVSEGEVYITGRTKDVIIRAGRNIYPYELEQVVAEIPRVRRGCVAVFGVPDADSGTERLVVVAETRETSAEVHQELREGIREVTVELLGMPADDIVICSPGAVLKTSSGKLRRPAMRERYASGNLQVEAHTVWHQVLRLTAQGALPAARKWGRTLVRFGFALYAWLTLVPVITLTWVLVALVLPRPDWSFRLVSAACRLFLRLTRIRLSVDGLEHVPDNPRYVLVANHASYLDGAILVAALREPLSFVVKGELSARFVFRRFLARLGAQFVDRSDTQRRVEDTRRIGQVLTAGRTVAFFPEGTFRRMPGLLPFHLGAFALAVEAGVPVLPVTIRGTRSILRDGSFMPRHGHIQLTVRAPLQPEQTPEMSVWAATVALRDRTRAVMLQQCGEPDLIRFRPGADD